MSTTAGGELFLFSTADCRTRAELGHSGAAERQQGERSQERTFQLVYTGVRAFSLTVALSLALAIVFTFAGMG